MFSNLEKIKKLRTEQFLVRIAEAKRIKNNEASYIDFLPFEETINFQKLLERHGQNPEIRKFTIATI